MVDLLKGLQLLRKDRTAALGLPMLIGVVVVVLLLGAALLVFAAPNPHRLINAPREGEEFVVYGQAKGDFEVDNAGGAVVGSFREVLVEVKDTAPGLLPGTIGLGAACFFGCEGKAFVRVTATGPNDTVVGNFDSEVHTINFGLVVDFQTRSWASGVIGFPAHGTSTWHLELVWVEGGKERILSTVNVAKEV